MRMRTYVFECDNTDPPLVSVRARTGYEAAEQAQRDGLKPRRWQLLPGIWVRCDTEQEAADA